MSNATVFHVCHECATAILNDDYSGMEPDTDYARVSAFVESNGWLIDAGRVNKSGYWECDACWQVEIGSAYALETMDTLPVEYS